MKFLTVHLRDPLPTWWFCNLDIPNSALNLNAWWHGILLSKKSPLGLSRKEERKHVGILHGTQQHRTHNTWSERKGTGRTDFFKTEHALWKVRPWVTRCPIPGPSPSSIHWSAAQRAAYEYNPLIHAPRLYQRLTVTSRLHAQLTRLHVLFVYFSCVHKNIYILQVWHALLGATDTKIQKALADLHSNENKINKYQDKKKCKFSTKIKIRLGWVWQAVYFGVND